MRRLPVTHLPALILGRWNTHIDKLVEASRSQQRVVQQVWPIGRANDENVSGCVDAVHFRQQLRHDAVHNTAAIGRATAGRRQSVELVKKDDARRRRSGAREYLDSKQKRNGRVRGNRASQTQASKHVKRIFTSQHIPREH